MARRRAMGHSLMVLSPHASRDHPRSPGTACVRNGYSSSPAQRCWLRGQIWSHFRPGLTQSQRLGCGVCLPEGHLSEPSSVFGETWQCKGYELKTKKTLSQFLFPPHPAVRPCPKDSAFSAPPLALCVTGTRLSTAGIK